MTWIPNSFEKPEFFWLLLIVPILVTWYILKHRNSSAVIIFSGYKGLKSTKLNYKTVLIHLKNVLRLLAIIAIIISLTRPYTTDHKEKIEVEGIDIVLSLDISGSMLAQDLKPNRIEAAKKIASEFIEKRPNDRIGLVAFAGAAFTQCPLTTDHHILQNLLSKLTNNMVVDGTAIGDGLGLAVERLRNSQAISKVIILMTDGINNMGFIDPMTAAMMAKEFNLRVYTIAVGTRGKAPYPVVTPFGTRYEMVDVKIDEDLLREIAIMTGGQYFRATDNKSLSEIYNKIDQMEKTKIQVAHFKNVKELFHLPLLLALIFVFLEMIIKYAIIKSLP